ncbi:MAG TPA: hypothetical protein VHP38_11040 [Ruminiclostridium sp.]|nr:hypothetical protein [Ruminiclostridium sp.]
MKNCIVLSLLLLIFSVAAKGQQNNTFRDKENPGSNKSEIRTDTIRKSYPLIIPREFRAVTDTLSIDHFPGSSRYYAKHPGFVPDPAFVKEPDKSAKYYLIIKDPLTNTVTR